MADLMMIVGAAVMTPVNVVPLIDDTDFKTIESAVAYNAAGMDLRWNFVNPATGVQTSTPVTPTTGGGSYDWGNQGDGIFSMKLPASGGASANNDTPGFGWWSGVCNGVLPWRGPVIQFSPAQVVNSLVIGSDRLQVHADEITDALIGVVDAGTAQSATSTTLVLRSAAAFANDELIGATIVITGGSAGVGQARTIIDYVGSTDTATVDAWTTTPTGTITYRIFAGPPGSAASPPAVNVEQWKGAAAPAMTGDAFARLGAPAGASMAADVAAVKAVLPAALVSGRIDASVGAMANNTVTAAAVAADAVTEIQTGLATSAALATVAGFVDTEVGAIKNVTDKLDTALEADGGVYRYTTNALENAPAGGGGGGAGDWSTGEKQQIRHRLGLDGDATAPAATPSLATAAAVAATAAGVAAVETDTQDIQSRLPAALVGGRMDSSTGAMAANVLTAAAAAADLTTELQSGLATASALATVAGNVTSIKARTDNLPDDPADQSLVISAATAIKDDTAAIRAKTATLPAAPAAVGDIPTAAAIADAVHDEVVEGTTTLRQSIRLANAANGGKVSGMGTSTATFRDLADTKNRVVATVTEEGNRLVVNRDLT